MSWGGADVWMRFIIAFWNYFFLKLLLLLLRDLLLLFETFLLNLWPQTQRQNLSNVLWEKQAVHLRPLKLEIYYSSSTRSLKSFFFLKKNFFFTSSRYFLLGLHLILSPLSDLVNEHRCLQSPLRNVLSSLEFYQIFLVVFAGASSMLLLMIFIWDVEISKSRNFAVEHSD